jgi:hypothetical protein
VKKYDWASLLLLSVASSIAGGVVAVRLCVNQPVLAQSGRGKVVEAEEFRLLRRDGTVCGRFQIDKEGRPGVLLFDNHGEVRIALGVLPNGSPHLALSDKDGKIRAAVAVWSDERSGVFLTDTAGKGRASLAVSANGSPTLAISDAAGTVRAVVGSAPVDLVPAPEVRNRSEAGLTLLSREGKLLWSAP